jgi:hypothetical protein
MAPIAVLARLLWHQKVKTTLKTLTKAHSENSFSTADGFGIVYGNIFHVARMLT